MGGSHPDYDFTAAALRAGKHVVTSNKEVVARYGDDLLKIARENNVCYRFEAAVGGGIPVISPLINCVGQNKVREIRGILNGTTNYILTKMFSFGESFEESLKDAQKRGYAESNPDADVLGIDACRKIAILTALVTGRLLPTENIHTEGITCIRKEDVLAAEKVGLVIKLLGRCIIKDDGMQVAVAPFMLGSDCPLSGVNGVYNAVEVIGDPIGNVMFFGQGAGAGATASAVVGDIMQIMRTGREYAEPVWEKGCEGMLDFADIEARHYIALEGADKDKVKSILGNIQVIAEGKELQIVTAAMKEGQLVEALNLLSGCTVKSRIRII
jgi:homoserine dehydrogenase